MKRSTPNQLWQITVLTNGDILRMPEIGTEIPVAEIYEDLTFAEQEHNSDGNRASGDHVPGSESR
jgi:hypothetical protein